MTSRFFHSLAFKLFLLMSGCLLLTIAGITWQQSSALRDVLDRQLEDSTVARAREVAKELSGLLRHWADVTSFAMHRLPGAPVDTYVAVAQSVLESDPDLVAFHVMKGATFETLVQKARGVDAKALAAADRAWVKELAAGATKPMALRATAKHASLAFRFEVAGESAPLWAVTTVSRDRILAALPDESVMRGWIVDGALKPLLGPAKGGALAKPLRDALKRAKSPYGFKSYVAPGGADFLGAYARVAEAGVTVALVQDARGAHLAILRSILRTLVWAWIFLLVAVMVSYVSSDGITKSLKALTAATQRIASGDFGTRLTVKGQDEVSHLSAAVNSMSSQIQTLLESKVEAARREKELETARLVQSTLFPRGDFETDVLRVFAKSFPASECGGDWWGYHPTGDGRYYLFIADATGHGVGAALVTAIAYSACKTLAAVMRAGAPTLRPSEILHTLNGALYETGFGSTSMTFFVALIDPAQGTMTFSNAGHCMPFIVPADAKDPRFTEGFGPDLNAASGGHRFKHYKVRARGTPLGMEQQAQLEEGFVHLKPGDRVLFYTDGLFECTDAKGTQWGERKLRKALDARSDLAANALHETVLTDAFDHFRGHPLADDITFVVFELLAKAREAAA